MPSTASAVLSLGEPAVRRSDAASTANGFDRGEKADTSGSGEIHSRSSVRGPCRVLAESASRSPRTLRKRHQNKHNATPGGLLTGTALGAGQRAGDQVQHRYSALTARSGRATGSVVRL